MAGRVEARAVAVRQGALVGAVLGFVGTYV